MPDSTQVQLRRGTAAQVAAETYAEAEPIVNLTDDRLHVGDGVTAGGIPHLNFKDSLYGTFRHAVAGGTGNALTASLQIAPTLSAALSILLRITLPNTGAVTLNLNGLGSAPILKAMDGALVPLEADDLIAGMYLELVFDGTQYIALNLSSAGNNLAGSELISVASVSGGASLDLSGITSEFANYRIELDGVSLSSTSASLRSRLSVSASYITASSSYGAFQKFLERTASGINEVNSVSDSQFFTMCSSGNFVGWVNGSIDLSCRAGLKAGLVWDLGKGSTAVDGYVIRAIGSGYLRTTTGQVDGFRLYPSTGSISGQARLYGLRASL